MKHNFKKFLLLPEGTGFSCALVEWPNMAQILAKGGGGGNRIEAGAELW